jgi:hypothetical protein
MAVSWDLGSDFMRTQLYQTPSIHRNSMTVGASLLSTINTPVVTTALGAAAAAGLPALSKTIANGKNPFLTNHWRIWNAAAFSLSLYAAFQPGRLDGRNAANNADKTLLDKQKERDKTMFVPEFWAFSIWPVIFLGELVLTYGSFFLKNGSPLSTILQASSGGFVIAQVFQMLWAATFRPKYIRQGGFPSWISAGMLTGIALSLSVSHAKSHVSKWLFPIAIHFGWTSAAALVNWNGNIAMVSGSAQTVAISAWTSAVVGAVAGVVVTVVRQAPVYGGTIAWALAACAGSMRRRLEERDRAIAKSKNSHNKWFPKPSVEEEIRSAKGYYGARIQKWLCTIGSIVSGATAAWFLLLVQPADVAP